MTILALEFSSARRSVAIARDGEFLAEAAEENSGRATNAFAMIEQVLAEAKIGREEIEAIAIGVGPGSYTGIRAAIAIAQGWQLARGIKLAGIRSPEALARRAQIEKILGRVNVVMDAQRGEFYRSAWEISDNVCRNISPLEIVAASEINAAIEAGEICIGPEAKQRLFPGAREIALLAMENQGFMEAGQLEPIYLRTTNFVKQTVKSY